MGISAIQHPFLYHTTDVYTFSNLIPPLSPSVIEDKTPLPPQLDDPVADDELFKDEPWIEPPVKADYGFNVIIGKNVFINSNCVFIDSLPITIGDRTLFGPSVSLFAGTHPVDPAVRNGMEGPEMGAPITIGEDCWIGGNVTILPGVTIGKGSTVGAGSVVTKVRWKVPVSRDSSSFYGWMGLFRGWKNRMATIRCRVQGLLICSQTGCAALSCCCWEPGPDYSED